MGNFANAAVLTAAAIAAYGEALVLAQQPSPQVEQLRKETAKGMKEIVVKPCGKNKEGWDVAETPHFRLFHKQSVAAAEKIMRIAEKTRWEMHRKWFGKDPEKWEPICDVILHPDGASYTGMTGISANSPGHTHIESRATGEVFIRKMHLRQDIHGMIEGVLPHEATHVVLAGMFGPHAVPRWADEGIAVHSESHERIDRHRKKLKDIAKERELFSVKTLLELKEYPPPKDIPTFYAQSVSLTEFLTKEKGPTVLTAFVRHALDKKDYDAAAKKYYGMTLQEMDRRWRKFALIDDRAPDAVPMGAPAPSKKRWVEKAMERGVSTGSPRSAPKHPPDRRSGSAGTPLAGAARRACLPSGRSCPGWSPVYHRS